MENLPHLPHLLQNDKPEQSWLWEEIPPRGWSANSSHYNEIYQSPSLLFTCTEVHKRKGEMTTDYHIQNSKLFNILNFLNTCVRIVAMFNVEFVLTMEIHNVLPLTGKSHKHLTKTNTYTRSFSDFFLVILQQIFDKQSFILSLYLNFIKLCQVICSLGIKLADSFFGFFLGHSGLSLHFSNPERFVSNYLLSQYCI